MKSFLVVLLLSSLAFPAYSLTVYETLQQNGNFSLLVSKINLYPPVVEQLSNQTSTIFAPINAAFSGVTLPPDNSTELLNILLYHTLGLSVNSSALFNGLLLPTLYAPASLNNQQQQLKVTIDAIGVYVNNIRIIENDIAASNGYVHVLDGIISEPADLVTVAQSGGLGILVAALDAAGLTNTTRTTPGLTVFGPTDAAFIAAGVAPGLPLGDYLLGPSGLTDLQNILTYHVTNVVGYSASLVNDQQLTMLNNQITTITTNPIRINNIEVIAPDVLASNGVAHVINGVLLPSDFSFTLDKLLIGLGNTALLNAIQLAGLQDILTGSTPYTIFAPTNDAFNALPNLPELLNNTALLAQYLQLHVVPGNVASVSLFNGQLIDTALILPSLNNQSQVVDVFRMDSEIRIQGALVVKADQFASNGIVHVIDQVLVPPDNIVAIAAATPFFSTLVELVVLAGLTDALNGNSLTVFAPVDDAFNALGSGSLNYLTSTQGLGDLTSILTYHVVGSVVYAADVPTVPTAVPTLQGSTIQVLRTGELVTVNTNTSVTLPNVIASNGVVHVIDAVLMPPTVAIDVPKVLLGLNLTTLISALNVAGLTSMFNGTTVNTIFAPTNQAFEQVDGLANLLNDIPTLTEVLSLHVVAGAVPNTDNAEYNAVLQGKVLSIDQNKVYVKGQKNNAQANILSYNTASNGVIIVIDAVLMPSAEWNYTAIIIGASVGGGVLIIGIAVLVYFYNRRSGYEKI